MASRKMADFRLPRSSRLVQKAQLIYKLYLLENARENLEQELRDFVYKAYEEVHGVLNSNVPTSATGDVTAALDKKYKAIVKLSASLKNHKAEHQTFNGVSFNYFQPLRAALSQQQLKLSLHSLQPSVQQHGSAQTASSSISKPNQKAVSEDKNQEVSTHILPAVIQSNVINEEESKVLLPSFQDGFPAISECRSKFQVLWGNSSDFQVPYQTPTSSQLLCFLKGKAETECSLEDTFSGSTKSKRKADNSDAPPGTSPDSNTKSYRHVVTEDQAPKMLPANTNQAPVFRPKRVRSGSLIYSFVIASETELWDVGDILIEVLMQESIHSRPSEREKHQDALAQVENASVFTELKSDALRCTQPGLKNSFGHSDRLAANHVNIPQFEIRKFEEAEVLVSHVFSPTNFYIQHVGSSEKLEPLFRDLKASDLCAEQNYIPDIGAQVICWLPQKEQWCRAEVVRISGVSRGDNKASDGAGRESSINVEVRRLDHGDSSCVSLSNIRELTPEIAALPLQALQVSLAHVTPVNGGDWTEEAVAWFKAMVHDRALYARLYPQGPTVTAELFLEKGKLGAMRRGASLSLRLAQNGHAHHSKLKNHCLVKKSAVQLKMREQESKWEKYLLSCYSQSKLCSLK